MNLTLVDMRFVKPLDIKMIQKLAQSHLGFITLEEGSIAGGAGSAVIEALMQHTLLKPTLTLGLPDTFIKHGATELIRQELQLDAAGIEQKISHYFNLC